MAILTVAREYGSGGKDVAGAVARDLGYRYIDRKQILEEMRSAGAKWEEQAAYFDENQPTVWERYKWSFRGYVALTQYHILQDALEDNIVILGRGGNSLLKGVPYALRIRTVAPAEQRIKRVIEWEETNTENARHLIEKVDREMAGAVYLIYGTRWDDPKQYDMVFDTGKQGMEEITATIKEELGRRDKAKTEEAMKILELKVLGAKVKASLATDPTLFISTLDVRFKEEGLVRFGLVVSGVVHDKKDIEKVEGIVKGICGTTPVEVNLQFRWHSRLGPWKF